jgi:hypothetical protein
MRSSELKQIPHKAGNTNDGAKGVLLCWCALLQRIVNDKVEEQIVSSQSAADFPTTLKVNEQLLVHKLCNRC